MSDSNDILQDYKASLTREDEKVLRQLAKLEKSGQYVSFPILFDQDLKKETNETRNVLHDVFSGLDIEMMNRSITHFPLHLKLKPRKKMILDERLETPKIYDPRFLLVQFWHLLSPKNLINGSFFIKHQGLSYIIVSLSSHEDCMRRLGYSCLQRFYRQLETHPKFRDMDSWMLFIDMIRCSLKEDNQRLPRLTTSFIHHAINILNQPKDPLYSSISDFVTRGKHLNGKDISWFILDMMKSKDFEKHYYYHCFALIVVAEGMDTEEDSKLIVTSGVMDRILMFCSSSLSSPEDKQMVLKVFESASRKKSCIDWVIPKKGLLSFLLQEVFDNQNAFHPEVNSLLQSIIFNLLELLNQHNHEEGALFYPSFSGQLLNLAFSLIKASPATNLHSLFTQCLEKTVTTMSTVQPDCVIVSEDEKKLLQSVMQEKPKADEVNDS